MVDEQRTQVDTTTEPETEFWSMYPMNVHLATTASSGGAFSLQNKKIMAFFAFAGLTVIITILAFMGGREYGLGLLSAIVGFAVGLIVSIFLYTRILRDKFNEDFESDTDNKVLKLFRIRLNDNDRDSKINGVDLMSYTSGEVFVTLRIEIGNSNDATEAVTAELLDRIFKSAHQLHLGVKNYNIRSEWRKSDVHHNHLRRLTKVQDPKLKATLAGIDNHQSKIFDESKVLGIHLAFVTRKNNLHGLESMISMIEDWRRDYFYMSSIRNLQWLEKDETVESLCSFLTIQMLDVTSNLNKKTVKYDIRKMVKVFSRNRFDPSTDVKVESKAAVVRRRKRK